MTDKYAELRRLAEAVIAEGDKWYDQDSIAAFLGCAADESYIVSASPSTVLSLLDELEACKKNDVRYRWLRKLPDFQFWTYAQFEDVTDTLEEQDAAIDAAMQEQKP